MYPQTWIRMNPGMSGILKPGTDESSNLNLDESWDPQTWIRMYLYPQTWIRMYPQIWIQMNPGILKPGSG